MNSVSSQSPSAITGLGQAGAPQANPLIEQLKAQMHDIAEPTAIGWWPLAWGWWIVIAIIAVMITIVIAVLVKRHHNNRYRREALAAIKNHTFPSHHAQAQHLMRISKQVALTAYPSERQSIASSFGQEWLAWLNRTTPKPLFDNAVSRDWQASLYQDQNNQPSDSLTELVISWVKKHHSSVRRLSANSSFINSHHHKEATDV